MFGDMFPALLLVVGGGWVAGWIYRAHLSHQRFMRVLELKAELNARIMDRLGSDPALVDFLKAGGAGDLYEVRRPEVAPPAPAPYSRILPSLQIGFVLSSAGGALLWYSGVVPDRGAPEMFKFFGALGVGLGVGALAAALAALVVARAWQKLQNGQRS